MHYGKFPVSAMILAFWFSVPAAAQKFHLEEASIADIHRAMRARQLTATRLVNLYLKRIDTYNGRCVSGAVDPATGYLLGDIAPVEKAGRVGALITLNLRGQRSKTDPLDADPNMPDALEVAKALDAEFARTGRLTGPLHGIPFAIKDQFDTFDMRSTSGAAANYANDRPPADAAIVARLRKAGAIILAKANMGEYASGDRSTHGGTTCNPYDTSRSAGRSSGGSGAAVSANLVTCAIGEETGPSARRRGQHPHRRPGPARLGEGGSDHCRPGRHGRSVRASDRRVGSVPRCADDRGGVQGAVPGRDDDDRENPRHRVRSVENSGGGDSPRAGGTRAAELGRGPLCARSLPARARRPQHPQRPRPARAIDVLRSRHHRGRHAAAQAPARGPAHPHAAVHPEERSQPAHAKNSHRHA